MQSVPVKLIGINRGQEGKDFKRLISLNDPDGVTHNLLIPECYFLNNAKRALKTMAYYGLMPTKRAVQAVNQLIASHPLDECIEVDVPTDLQVVEIWQRKQAQTG